MRSSQRPTPTQPQQQLGAAAGLQQRAALGVEGRRQTRQLVLPRLLGLLP
jgi:hypothetical protein